MPDLERMTDEEIAATIRQVAGQLADLMNAAAGHGLRCTVDFVPNSFMGGSDGPETVAPEVMIRHVRTL